MLVKKPTIDSDIKTILSQHSGRWLSAKQVADRVGVPWQCVARRLAKMAAFSEIDSQEITTVALRHRVRLSHLYRSWAASDSLPHWLQPRFNEKQIVGARLIIGRASIRRKNAKNQ